MCLKTSGTMLIVTARLKCGYSLTGYGTVKTAPMRVVCGNHMLVLAMWGLLSVWVTVGGCALAEQREMMFDSGEQETQNCELSLAWLKQALKPGAAYLVSHGADSIALSIIIDIPSPSGL